VRFTLHSGTTNTIGILPDDLGEMSPGIEVDRAGGVRLAIPVPVSHLVVVPLIRDSHGSGLIPQLRNVAGRAPDGNILAITTSSESLVMLKNTSLGNCVGETSQPAIPLYVGSRVIGSMGIVLVEHNSLV
jgi:hypothetical protein